MLEQANKVGEAGVMMGAATAVRRVSLFFMLVIALIFGLDAMIGFGLRHIETGPYGASNKIMQGQVNAQILISGSSRALSHYDPRIIQAETGRSAFNLGRNGSQTDMQLAVLRAYLEHNRKPEMVLHNLDSFSFEATRRVYNPGQYVPYLYENALYQPLQEIDSNTFRRRYLPVYGYVVDDMSFSWMLGLGRLFGWNPAEDHFQGFNPRPAEWTDEFQRFKVANPKGVSWPIDPEGVRDVEALLRMCQEKNIKLVLVYSPEFLEMQKMTQNREQVFDKFRDFATRYRVPLWDYSDWKYAASTQYFQNSQHLNAAGATVFSQDVAHRLQGGFEMQAEGSMRSAK